MFEACFAPGYDDCCTELSRKLVRARKPHKCGECGHTINSRQRYEAIAEVFDGEFGTHKTCIPCRDVRESLFPHGGWAFGNVWPDIHQEYCVYGDDPFCICPEPERSDDEPITSNPS